MSKLLFPYLLLSLPFLLVGQAITDAQTNADENLLGGMVEVEVTWKYPDSLAFSNLSADTLGGRLQVIKWDPPQRTKQDGEWFDRTILYLLPMDTGNFVVPLRIYLQGKSKNYPINGAIDPFYVKGNNKVNSIEELLADAPMIEVEEPKGRPNYLLWSILAISAFIVFGLIYWLLHGRKSSASTQKPISPFEVAMHELKLLREENIQVDDKTFYARLSMTFRTYLKKEKSIPALDAISSELMQRLKQIELGGQELTELKNFLQRADLAKYAKGSIDADDRKIDLDKIQQILINQNKKELENA